MIKLNKNKIFAAFIFSILFFLCCKNKEQANTSNTFYINYICKNDSLLQVLNNATSGKVAYYDKERNLQIVSLNFITEEHPNTHYFKVGSELPAKPELNTIKYEIVFNESMVNDSIAYSLKKYFYSKNGWKKKSEMGVIKVFNYPIELDKKLRVINRVVASTVLKTIVAETYDK